MHIFENKNKKKRYSGLSKQDKEQIFIRKKWKAFVQDPENKVGVHTLFNRQTDPDAHGQYLHLDGLGILSMGHLPSLIISKISVDPSALQSILQGTLPPNWVARFLLLLPG